MTVNNIDCLLKEEEYLQPLIDETVEELFWQVAKIHLKQCKSCNSGSEDVCTVYTTFSGGYQIRFALCAERALMKRITENMAEEPVTDPEDIEEYMKEFLNVICGHVVASVFGKTKTSARFHTPCFAEGYYIPADGNDNVHTVVTKCYIDEYSETAMLTHDQFSDIGRKGLN